MKNKNILDMFPNSDGSVFNNSLVSKNKLSATKSVQKG
jgi:S-adenosylmethionine:tRNA-ribosyltransferase-isomerase (queuine synthetase)